MADDLMLAIETSSRRGSVALGRPAQLLGARSLAAERRNAAELLPAIHELLTEAGSGPREVEYLCFSQGPGSFTGLRIAATLARLWLSVTECRVVAAPSLEVLARNALGTTPAPKHVAALVDARPGQVFAARFEVDAQTLRAIDPPALRDAEPWIASLPAGSAAVGDAVARYRAGLERVGVTGLPEDACYPDAAQTLAVGWQRVAAGEFCTSEKITPVYLRPPECEEAYDRNRAAARERRQE